MRGHALPVVDIYCGIGNMQRARLYTVSKDRTLKIWSLYTGNLISTILFPRMLTAIQVDACEQFAYVGTVDGSIYQVDLYQKVESRRMMTALVDAHDGADAIKSVDATNSHLFKGHLQAVTKLCLSFDSNTLVSSSEDESCIVWDTSSRQALRSYNNHKAPVSSVTITMRPIHSSSVTSSRQNQQQNSVIKPFKKFQMTGDVGHDHSMVWMHPMSSNVSRMTARDSLVWEGEGGEIEGEDEFFT